MAKPARQTAFKLDFPQSLGLYDDYPAAQKAVDFLADREFAVENLMIVGTDLKQVERVTGRLNYPKVALAGALSGAWMGLLFGLIVGLFAEEGSWLALVVTAIALGAAFGIIWGVVGYAATGGQRDFSSVSQIVPSKYEVLVEHKLLGQAQDLLAQMPGRPL